MNFKIAISTCPNDIFIFYAIIEKKIPLKYNFDFSFFDIQELNKLSERGDYDIIKISAVKFLQIKDKYTILSSGGAFSEKIGPIIVAKKNFNLEEIKNKSVGIPGENTTANYLFDYFIKQPVKKVFMRFDKIIPSLLEGKIDLGVLIHEGRFVYNNYKLNLIIDLGELWWEKFKLPLPLGIIVLKKGVEKYKSDIEEIIKSSIQFGWKNFNKFNDFIKKYSQENDDAIIEKHIKTYVNKYSYDFGNMGEKALERLLNFEER